MGCPSIRIQKQIDLLAGGIVMALAIDVTRREYGNVLAGVVVLSVVYGLLAPSFRESSITAE